MPQAKYISVEIDGSQVEIESPEKLPIAITYQLESGDDFQTKKSNEALNVTVPATLANDQLFNTFHNPSIEDLTSGQLFRNTRSCVIRANGSELLVGKCFLKSASHRARPESYKFDCYGGNGDWILQLKEATLYDFLKHIQFAYTKTKIEDSWAFNGTSEQLPYVFAPVRYTLPFDARPFNAADSIAQKLEHYNVTPTYLRPSLSKYWLIYWAFKKIGYRVQSNFFNLEFFRRQVMPWTWGAFPYSLGTEQAVHKFNAATYNPADTDNLNSFDFSGGVDQYLDLNVLVSPNLPETFDNNATQTGGLFKDYSYNAAAGEMKWTYQTNEDFGVQEVTLSLTLFYRGAVGSGNDVTIDVDWYKESGGGRTFIGRANIDNADSGGAFGGQVYFNGPKTIYMQQIVSPGDAIVAKVYLKLRQLSSVGLCYVADMRVASFQFEYFRTPINAGATIDFSNYLVFKKYKFLDFLKGVVDEFNLTYGTDAVNKVVYFEPAHAYSTNASPMPNQPGYINGNWIDWSGKQDLSKDSEIELFSEMERELVFRYKEDGSDETLKNVQERVQNQYSVSQRNITTAANSWALTKSMLAAGKYILPERFTKGVKEIENSFFAPCMHHEVKEWEGITSIAPQLICIITNGSTPWNEGAITPKSAYYKGNVSGVGGWRWDGTDKTTLPFMFAVNYKSGGHNDPILSYSDEKIGSQIGPGLLRRMYLQRLAIMRNGQKYKTWMHLVNNDVQNILHREFIVCRNQKWILQKIDRYRPLSEESTACELDKFTPIAQADVDAVYPTASSVNGNPDRTDIFEIKYQNLMCLPTDIPR